MLLVLKGHGASISLNPSGASQEGRIEERVENTEIDAPVRGSLSWAPFRAGSCHACPLPFTFICRFPLNIWLWLLLLSHPLVCATQMVYMLY